MQYDTPLYDLPLYDFDLSYSEAVADAIATILDNPRIHRSWLIRAYPRDASTATDPPTTIEVLLSTDGHKNRPTDSEQLQYKEAIVVPYDVSFGIDALWGQSEMSLGEIVIGDVDNSLRYLMSEDWQGRQVDVYVGPRNGTQVQFGRVGRLLSRDISSIRDTLRVIVDDFNFKFRKPLQTNTYAGTGGLDGDSELKGRLRPVLLGRARRFEPVLVDGTNRVYQLHDGAIESIDGGVEVAGVPLSFDADVADITTATPGAGEYATSLATGYIKLGEDPNGVVVVAAAQGHNSSSFGYVDTVSGLLKLLSVTFADLDENDLGLVTFATLATHTAEMGGYFPDKIEILDVMNLFHRSAASYGWIRSNRVFDVGRITDPATATDYFTLDASRDEIRQEPWEDNPFEVRVWRVVVRYRPYPRTLSETEIDSSVSLATRQDYGEDYRFVESFDTDILTQTSEAKDITIDTYLDDEADAQSLADEQFALRSVLRRYVTVSARIGLIKRGVGDVVELVDTSLPATRKFVILNVENTAAIAGESDRVVWQCFG